MASRDWRAEVILPSMPMGAMGTWLLTLGARARPALGGVPGFEDLDAVRIAAELGCSSMITEDAALVRGIVMSTPFQKRIKSNP